jgi:hypothetical protein
MLVWGRTEALPARREAAGPPAATAGQEVSLWPSSAPAVHLTAQDASWFMGAFLDELAGGSQDPSEGAAPPACTQPLAMPAFVTVYGPAMAPVRIEAPQGSLADAARGAARDVVRRAGRALEPGPLRVRIDVVTAMQPLAVEKREEFAAQGFGAPCGVAAQGAGKVAFFLPADAASHVSGAHEAMLQAASQRAGLEPLAWHRPAMRMWLVLAQGFVNNAPGGRYALESDRGLVPMDAPTVARVLRASRLAADYLVRAQQEDGTYLTYWDPAGGLRGGCDSVPEQAAAAAALAEVCELRSRPEYLESCYNAVSYLMRYTTSDTRNPHMAFTQRQEVCHTVGETEASAHVLEAVCRYRHVSGRTEPDAWMAALAEFLLFMQREDGHFDLKYDGQTGAREMPAAGAGKVAPQAKAALALVLAYRELSVPRYLDGARRALQALRADEAEQRGPLEPDDARWVVLALREAGAFLDTEDYGAWAERVAEQRRAVQLLPGDVPSADLAGGTLGEVPPRCGPTAEDLVVHASACLLGAKDAGPGAEAARRAASYVMRLQYVPENSYYLSEPDACVGGVREQLGSNIVRVQTMEAVLRGLAALTRVELGGMQEHD